MTLLDTAGIAAGTSIVSGTLAIFAAIAGLATGQATVVGDVWAQAAGTVAGASTATGAAAIVFHVSADAQGDATATVEAGIGQTVTGRAYGEGTLEADLTTTAAGLATGTSSALGTAFRTIDVKGRVSGVGTFVWAGAPLPIHGTSVVVGTPVVEQHLPAVRAIVSSSKQFRFRQLLQRGDLVIFLCDRAGPVSPVWVRYTMYQVFPDGAQRRVGPARKASVTGEVGEFYVSERAGELGQPGQWIVLWEWRYSHASATQSKEMEFEVLDAALANCPQDVTVRHQKYGWN